MKKILFTLTLLFSGLIYSQKNSKSDLIGEWSFIHLQDENGIKHTEIPIRFKGKEAVEKINRDSYNFNENGEYVSTNPLNTSKGKWFYDEEKKQINLKLKISPDHKYWESLKKIVKKEKDGHYYQKPVQKQILYLKKDSMVIADNLRYVLIYKRK